MRKLLITLAAAALAAAITASPADAKPGKGKGKSKGHGFSVSEFSGNHGVRRRGPPDWAPAHGYRARQAQRARTRYYRQLC